MDRRTLPSKGVTRVTGNSFQDPQILTGDYNSYITLQPAGVGSGRLTDIAKAFQFYRFTKMKITMAPWYCAGGGQLSPGTLGYVAEEIPSLGSGPSSAVAELPFIMPYAGQVISSSTGVQQSCTQMMSKSIPRKILLGSNPMKWYVTNASSEDDFIVQGTIVVAVATPVATGATHIPLWLTWECELAGDIAAVLQIFRPLPEEAKEDNQSELEVISVADSGRPTPSVGQLLRASRASTALIQRPRGPK
jgi:hypothetical protein